MAGAAAASSSSSAAGASSSRPSPRSASGPATRMKGGGNGTGGTSSGGNGATGGTATNGMHHMSVAHQSAPLSSRRAPPLDLNTVERRAKGPLIKEVPKLKRCHDLQEAPTYYPTPDEFKDPFAYIRKIAPEGRKYGIVKIIPPDFWNSDFSIDTERFHFRTRRQELNSVEGGTSNDRPLVSCNQQPKVLNQSENDESGTRANLNYLDQLSKFHAQSGSNLSRFPCVDKRPLDLYRLKKAVEVRGGFAQVCKFKKWAEIGRDLGYSGKIMSSLSTSLKNSYQRYLQPYEEWVKQAKPGLQAMNGDHGGHSTPGGSPKKTERTRSSPGSPSAKQMPTLTTSTATDTDETDKDTIMGDATPSNATPAPTSGFTAVNSNGFTAVNSGSSSFTSMAATPNGIKREAENLSTPSRRSESESAKNTPDPKNGNSSALKRGHTENSSKSLSRNNDENEPGERRSKRLKKEPAPTVAGSHMTLHRPSTPRVGADRSKAKPGEKCEICGRGNDNVNMLICDECDHGYHTYCLDPPVKTIPERDWYCNRCLVGTGDFGFEDGGIYSLKQFQEKANNFKERHFEGKTPYDPVYNRKRQPTEDEVEAEFWRLVENLQETVEVEYGADIHSTTHGSGFPTIEKNPQDPMAQDPWNLNILPLHQDSLFRHIKSDISGMTVPWLYVGMVFSTFCWHNEDHYTYSANYQHFGATKTWYGIPSSDAQKFEDAMREAVPELFEQQPDLLFQLVTLLTPAQLKKAGVSVYALDQRAGQFVITFPQAYHAGFNHGFNFNEAVNFAPADWEPFGQMSVERYQEFKRSPVFSHDELLLTAAKNDTTIKTATWLAPALSRIRDRELAERDALRKNVESFKEEVNEDDLPEDQYQCGVCKVYCYLSQITCKCTSNVTCPTHYRDICDCPTSNLVLRLKFSDPSLADIVSKVQDKANSPKAWVTKLEKSMADTPRPQLKVLRTLLSEGERIPYPIPELAPLKQFVERCNEWVEEATNYISRKQQNRRKNEKVWRKGAKAAELEERDKEHRKLDNIFKLLNEADRLGFDCPEIEQLRERADAIRDFQRRAKKALSNPSLSTAREFEELAESGRSFNVDLVETEELEKLLQKLKWIEHARERRTSYLSLREVTNLITEGTELGIPDHDEQMAHFKQQKIAGDLWEAKAKELMSAEIVHFQQLEALSGQASSLPVSQETLDQVGQSLNKQREAHRQIISLYKRSQAPKFEDRPKYKDVREVMDSLVELHSKPTGTIDLEKEQKRHEDWMRKGKKLFGKANAPLHILLIHMNYVEQRNNACFDWKEDRPRTPVEPSSREHTPSNEYTDSHRGRQREVFCICRQPEAGMMIECEVCHEWYHGKCLKIARGKVKEDDKYTCPICDYRVKIPRDAARPKLEELIDWRNEIPKLPFIPDEMECLDRIINTAQSFRDHIQSSSLGLTSAELPIMRFYLRKIEGAEILLAHETNFFRTELHRWWPLAPEPPPIIEVSNSTRKPRPTKQQKLMAQYGVKTPEELPVTLRTKAHTFKTRKSSEPNKPAPIKPAPSKSHSQPPNSSASMSPVQMHNPQLPTTPQFDYSSRYSLPSSTQASPQYSQSSQHTSPILMNPLRGSTLDPVLGNYQPSGGSQSHHYQATAPSEREREFKSIFDPMMNHDTSDGSSSVPHGIPTGFKEAAAAALQLTGDPIDPNLTKQF